MTRTRSIIVFLALFLLSIVATFSTVAQTQPTDQTTPQPSVGQQTVRYCVTSGSQNAAAVVAMWQGDPNRSALCPEGKTPTLDHCSMPRVPTQCATVNAAGQTVTGQEGLCYYRCV